MTNRFEWYFFFLREKHFTLNYELKLARYKLLRIEPIQQIEQ